MNERAARRHERAGARGRQRALRARRRRCSTAAPTPTPTAQGWTALHQIAWSRRHNAGFNLPGPVPTGGLDSLDLVRKLVAHGANVNARHDEGAARRQPQQLNRIGATPFLMAAKSDDVPLMRVLLELGADPSLTTNRGTTALMAAAGVGIWAPGENPGTHEEALAAVKLALEAGGGKVQRHRSGRRDGAARRGVSRRRDSGDSVPDRQGRAARRRRTRRAGRRSSPPTAWSTRPRCSSGIPRPPRCCAARARAAGAARRAGAGAGRRRPAGGRPKTIWDGVFTEEQAARGQERYRTSCAAVPRRGSARRAGAGAGGAGVPRRWNGSTRARHGAGDHAVDAAGGARQSRARRPTWTSSATC